MATVQTSNYEGIERAIANIMMAKWVGMPVELGDFTKITLGTPCGVIAHGTLNSPFSDRNPQFEWLHWTIPIHIFFDYTNDAEAHELFRSFRIDIIKLFQGNRYLDDGIQSRPAGYQGQAIDCKIMRSPRPMYITMDGKTYLMASYELWVAEKVYVSYP
jgi:hypothetical protein